MYGIGEKRTWCCRQIECSMVWNWCEKPTMLYIQRVVYGLMYGIGMRRPWTTLCTSWSLHTNLIHETIDHSVNSTSWSLLINSIYETMDHSVYNTMVSSHQFHTWDQGPLYLSIQHHGLFSPVSYMRPGTTLSVYNNMVSSCQFHTWDHRPLYIHHGLFTPI